MTKTFKEVQGIEEACWVGYKKVGMKKKGDRMVPNCVKEEVVDNLLGKDYVYESVADMYKGQFTKAQLAKMKQTWATKKASDVDQRTKDFVKNLDQFSQMDIKNANIKYISALIEEVQKEEFELVSNFNNIVEENEMRVLVRRNKDLKEYFSADQLERLAKAYSVMKDRTISVSNAQKLGKMVDGIPDHALNDLRKKKIPFISGLALSRMIKRKIPVTESTYEDKEEKQIVEADLSKSQIKKVHKQADDLPKKDFIKRYGKDGDSVRYATATNMVKKKLGLGESNFIKKGELKMNDTYKQRLTSAMEHFNISSLGELNEDDHKTFFSYVEDMKEGLSAAQKKLPPALQKAIAAKMKDKKEVKEDLVGGQKKLDKDKDGDLDAKDFAMLRKSKNEEDAYDKDDEKPKPKPKKEDVSDMNKKKHAAYKDPKRGEHDVVDPKPVMKQTKEMWSKAGDDLEETQSKAKYMKTPSQDTDGEMPPVEKKKPMKASYKMMRDQMKKADTGSKETKVDTDPSIDYKH